MNGRETNPAQIAEAVMSNPNYVEGTQVCFASCWSGSSGLQEFAVIGDRLYSQHAVARMQPSGQKLSSGQPSNINHNPTSGDWAGTEPGINVWGGQQFIRGRSVSPNFIEDILQNAAPVQQANLNWNYTSGNLQIILSPDKTAVITILDVH